MNFVNRNIFPALLVFLVSSIASAQSVPTSLFACLNGNGNLYGVTPTGKLGEGCAAGDLPVSLGSAGQVSASNGLVGTITNGVVDIGVAPGLAIPPSCPPGQIAIADGQGAWICTLPNLNGNPNPAAKVWVLPNVQERRTLDVALISDGIQYGTEMQILNPSNATANVTCLFFNRRGNLILSESQSRDISPGGRTTCDIRRSDAVPTWMMLVSNQNVLVDAQNRTFYALPEGPFFGVGVEGMPGFGQDPAVYPLDCDYPDGYEFVCDMAREFGLE
jgi:hypothetical protein